LGAKRSVHVIVPNTARMTGRDPISRSVLCCPRGAAHPAEHTTSMQLLAWVNDDRADVGLDCTRLEGIGDARRE